MKHRVFNATATDGNVSKRLKAFTYLDALYEALEWLGYHVLVTVVEEDEYTEKEKQDGQA
jgi:hypothetical protein